MDARWTFTIIVAFFVYQRFIGGGGGDERMLDTFFTTLVCEFKFWEYCILVVVTHCVKNRKTSEREYAFSINTRLSVEILARAQMFTAFFTLYQEWHFMSWLLVTGLEILFIDVFRSNLIPWVLRKLQIYDQLVFKFLKIPPEAQS